MADLVPIYVAHPLGSEVPTRELNRGKAARWVAWLAERYLCAPVCTWITLAEVWPETMRDVGLEVDFALVKLVDVVVLCGDHVSSGMRAESEWASLVIDVTRYHCSLPGLLGESECDWLDGEMARVGIERRDD